MIKSSKVLKVVASIDEEDKKKSKNKKIECYIITSGSGTDEPIFLCGKIRPPLI